MKSVAVKEKIVFTVLCIWSFIHSYLLIRNITGFWFAAPDGNTYVKLDNNKYFNPVELFYPFTYNESPNIWDYDTRLYDYSEYFVYVGGVWMIYFLYRYLKGSK